MASIPPWAADRFSPCLRSEPNQAAADLTVACRKGMARPGPRSPATFSKPTVDTTGQSKPCSTYLLARAAGWFFRLARLLAENPGREQRDRQAGRKHLGERHGHIDRWVVVHLFELLCLPLSLFDLQLAR